LSTSSIAHWPQFGHIRFAIRVIAAQEPWVIQDVSLLLTTVVLK
jgi:hypothetical protein